MELKTIFFLVRAALVLLYLATYLAEHQRRREGDKVIWLGRDWRAERSA